MPDIFSSIQQTLTDSIRMSILHTTQRNTTTIFETILYSILISFMTYITQNAMDFSVPLSKYQDYFRRLVYRKYILRIEGKTSTATSIYSSRTRVTSIYTDKFKAVWGFILKHLSKNRTIYEIREVVNTYRLRIDDDDNQDRNDGMYIVSQRERFLLDADLEIYATTNEHTENSEHKMLTRTNMVEIVLFSYKSDTNVLKQFVDNITREYLSELADSRTNKRYMYSLAKSTQDSSQEVVSDWCESEFHSSKTFQNVFFDNKPRVLDQIDFFLKNREWYDTYGIPYTLGIGLYGPPGTGKTSFIKALMNHVKDRHLVNLSLSLIRTKTQLYEYYYESRYNENNTPNSIGFEKKMIVIEDIDCAGEIVMERHTEQREEPVDWSCSFACSSACSSTDEHPKTVDYSDITLNPRIQNLDDEIQKTVKENIMSETRKIVSKMNARSDDKITLDDILNLWDGIRETPGRILVITSNHYDKLDAAIRRPGRIDITLGLENASRETIAEMFLHFYKKPIDTEILSKIESRLYSPAEIVNIYTTYKTDDVGFCERLVTNKKL